jgi:hypothetical protein
MKVDEEIGKRPSEPPSAGERPDKPPVADELRELVNTAKAGDASVLPRIREILDDHPEVWQHVGDLEKLVRLNWIALLGSKEPLTAESCQRKTEEMRADLEGEKPTRLESLLVGQIVTGWLELNHAQFRLSDPASKTTVQTALDLKRAESASKRYLQSIRLLTTVRALLPNGLMPASHLKVFDPKKKSG